MSDIEVTFQSNGEEIGELFEQACERALVRMGSSAEGFAKKNLTQSKAVDTGRLRGSITFATAAEHSGGQSPAKSADFSTHGKADEKSVYIGTNVEYAPYIELGTSKMAARPYIKPAVTEHNEVYKRIIEDEMKKA